MFASFLTPFSIPILRYTMNKNILLVLIAVVLLGYLFVIRSQTTWQGFYYPEGVVLATDPDDTNTFVAGPVFTTKGQCLSWGRDKVRSNPDADFECGKNCSYREGIGETICEENTDH